MSYGKRGGSIMVRVTEITTDGVAIHVGREHLFMPYDEFPWFRRAPVEDVFDVVAPDS